MKKTASVVLFSFVKAAITISLIVIICTKIDFSALARHLGIKDRSAESLRALVSNTATVLRSDDAAAAMTMSEQIPGDVQPWH